MFANLPIDITALASIIVTATGFGLIGNHAGATEQSADNVHIAADSMVSNLDDANTVAAAFTTKSFYSECSALFNESEQLKSSYSYLQLSRLRLVT